MKTKENNKKEVRYSGKQQFITINGIVMTREQYLEWKKERE